MGRSRFVTVAKGKTVEQAHRAARELIRWEAQEAQGYSGTIYETHYVSVIELSPTQFKAVYAAAPAQQRKNYREAPKATKVEKAIAIARLLMAVNYQGRMQSEGCAQAIPAGKNCWVFFGEARS